MSNSNIVGLEELKKFYNVKTRAAVVKCLRRDRIKYFENGVWTTLNAINAALGLGDNVQPIPYSVDEVA